MDVTNEPVPETSSPTEKMDVAAAESEQQPPPPPPPQQQQPEIIDLTGLSSDDDSNDGSEQGAYDDDDSGDESEVEIRLNQETRAQLQRAVAAVSQARLRHVLKTLIETDQAVEIALTRELITLRRETQAVVSRWERCVHCDAEYDVNTRRRADECAFHPGELEVDDDGFPDWDEDTHGEKDTAENRLQYPEEFVWTCCDKSGTAPGCVEGEHQPMEVTKKRKRSD